MTGTGKRRGGPRGPLVLDSRELGRRPGSAKHVRTQVSAPSDLGTAMFTVPPGAQVELDLRLESVVEGVLVSGAVRAPAYGECSRCLEPFSDQVAVELRELFYYPDRADEVAGDDEEEPLRIVDDHLDIEPPLRDALVLSFPMSPVCTPDCAGLCAECGVRLDDAELGHAHRSADPRWAKLSSLIENKEKD
jgi:uncharacterized protein